MARGQKQILPELGTVIGLLEQKNIEGAKDLGGEQYFRLVIRLATIRLPMPNDQCFVERARRDAMGNGGIKAQAQIREPACPARARREIDMGHPGYELVIISQWHTLNRSFPSLDVSFQ